MKCPKCQFENPEDLKYGNNGTIHGEIAFVTGIMGQAARFNGRNSYLDMGDKIDMHNQDFTLSLWVKSDNYNQFAKLINKGQTGAGTPRDSGYSLRLFSPFNVYFNSQNPRLICAEQFIGQRWLKNRHR